MVNAAGGRVGGCNLSHSDGDNQREDAAHHPDDADGSTAAGAQRRRKRGEAAGDDADDGEGNGEVLERAHAARQLLRISHLMKDFNVVGGARLLVGHNPSRGMTKQCHRVE
jgi:hypothetical protein